LIKGGVYFAVAIGNHERHARKASHCAARKNRDHAPQSLLLLLALALHI